MCNLIQILKVVVYQIVSFCCRMVLDAKMWQLVVPCDAQTD